LSHSQKVSFVWSIGFRADFMDKDCPFVMVSVNAFVVPDPFVNETEELPEPPMPKTVPPVVYVRVTPLANVLPMLLVTPLKVVSIMPVVL
jgi:hypothetical protein